MHNFLTEEAINKIREEIEYRKVVLRHKILEDVKEARAHGDLSENYEYKAAKQEKGKNEGRIRYLERMIKTATIISDESAENEAGLGKIIRVRFLSDNEVEEFILVTTIESDPMNNLISIESPLGQAIYKRKIGDELVVESPEGTYSVRIEEILIK
ncbi:MAG: greA [Clostridiales bacterium]|nr:greA [Clostridiales bacterium]